MREEKWLSSSLPKVRKKVRTKDSKSTMASLVKFCTPIKTKADNFNDESSNKHNPVTSADFSLDSLELSQVDSKMMYQAIENKVIIWD